MFKNSKLGGLFFRASIVLAFIAIELATFFYLKDDSGNFIGVTGMSIAEYMRNYGGPQFLFAAYAQKLVFVALATYPVLIMVLWAREDGVIGHMLSINLFRRIYRTIIINLISFVVLIFFFLTIKNPIQLITDPLDFQATFYTLIPLVWIAYLYSILDLLFPITILRKLISKNQLLVTALVILTIISLNPVVTPFHLEGLLRFWSNLFLEPTIKFASIIAHFFGFQTEVFSFPGSSYPDFGTERFHTGITADCSGYEGVTLISILLLGYCYFQRSTLLLSRALLILPIAIFSMFLLNAIRIVILIAIGHYYSPVLAFNGFHTVGGWLNLLIVLILSLSALSRFQIFRKDRNTNSYIISGNTNIPFIFPLMALIGTSLLTKIFNPDFQWLYPIPIAIAAAIIFSIKDILRSILIYPSIFSVAVGVLVFVLWIILIPADNSQNLLFFEQIQAAPIWISLSWLICRIIGATLIVPISEELAFRGFMLPRLERFFSSLLAKQSLSKSSFIDVKLMSIILSLALTSFIFGLLHSDILAGTVAGLFYGLVYLKRRNLMDAVMAHGVTNALLAIDVIYLGNWSYW